MVNASIRRRPQTRTAQKPIPTVKFPAMSFLVKEIPKEQPTVPANENPKWGIKMKIFAVICGFITYILLVMSAKTIYAKHQRLDKMDILVQQTEEMMHNLHTIDQNLAIKLEIMENMAYDDYDTTIGTYTI